ncbi:hypothetical protein AAC387_Pa12g1795 [Persea americana]
MCGALFSSGKGLPLAWLVSGHQQCQPSWLLLQRSILNHCPRCESIASLRAASLMERLDRWGTYGRRTLRGILDSKRRESSVVKDSSYSSGLGVVFIDSFREGQIRNIGQGAYVN